MRRMWAAALVSLLGCGDPAPPAIAPEPAVPPLVIPPVEPAPTEAPPVVEVPVEPTPPVAELIAPEPPLDVIPSDEAGAFEDVEDEDDGPPPLQPELRAAVRLGESAWVDDPETAASAGLIDPSGEDDASAVFSVEATIEHQRRTYVLFRAPGGLPEYATMAARGGPAELRFALWLARLERHTDADGLDEVRRVAAVRLHDLALASADAGYASCTVASELRARDLDGDGEVELTVVAAAGAEPDGEEHCGAVAFLVGGDDLNVQARFTREHRAEHTGADGDRLLTDDTTWVVRDVNADGHDDLHVVERFTYRDDFEGDYVGGGRTDPGWHTHTSGRREVDCPYDISADAWTCPAASGVTLGSRLFAPPSDLASGLATAFDGPPWTDPPAE